MVHVTSDLARHAGQADIMREEHDAAIGCQPGSTNIPDGYDWPAFVAHANRAGFSGWWTVDPFCDPDDVLAWTRETLAYVRGESTGATGAAGANRKEQS